MKHNIVRLVLVIGLWAMALSGAQAQTQAVVRLEPAQAEVVAGQAVDVAVWVEGVVGLYGFQVELAYNPQVVEVVDLVADQEGVQVGLGNFLDASFIALNKVDSTLGVVTIAATQVNPSQPKDGSGPLVIIKLKGVKAGASSPLELKSAVLASREGEQLPASLVSGSIRVVSEATGQATATPMATVAPLSTQQLEARATSEPATSAPAAEATSTPQPESATPSAAYPASGESPVPTVTAAQAAKSATARPTPSLSQASPTPKATLLATAAAAGQPTAGEAGSTATPTPSAEATGGSSGGWWVWVLVGALVVLVCVGLVMWRRRAAREPKP